MCESKTGVMLLAVGVCGFLLPMPVACRAGTEAAAVETPMSDAAREPATGEARAPAAEKKAAKPDTGGVLVQFVVAVPADGQPALDAIYMPNSLDGWAAKGRRLVRMADGLFLGAWTFPQDTRLEYKFSSQASWGGVEKDPAGGEMRNRVIHVSKDADRVVVFAQVANWLDRRASQRLIAQADFAGAAKPSPHSTLSGDIRRHRQIEAPGLGNARDLVVWLPPGYEQGKSKRYPVIYFHDGQNLFDAATSFKGIEWRLDEIAAELMQSGKLRPCILVGINNTTNRNTEMIPPAKPPHTGGQGDQYLKFIVSEAKPLIDKSYRTKPDRENTFIVGSSLAGLHVVYTACRKSDVFGGFGILVPTLDWADQRALRMTREATIPSKTKFWIEVGAGEGVWARVAAGTAMATHLNPVRELVRILEEKGFEDDKVMHYREIPGHFHDEAAWQQRAPDMLVWLLGSGS